MSATPFPEDWFIEETGERLILDQKKVAAEISRLRTALTEARDALRNDFEPDNQSMAYKRADGALRRKVGWAMSKYDCEICRGSGVVRLPIYRSVAAIDFHPVEPTMQESSRSYPCPECANTAPSDRIALVECHTMVDSRIDAADPAFIGAAKNSAAHSLVELLLDGGFIRFRRRPESLRDLAFPLQATLGVVSPRHVSDMETRIATHQEKLAREVMAEAESQIGNWGSEYRSQGLMKEDAYRLMRSALADILAKRAAWKAA